MTGVVFSGVSCSGQGSRPGLWLWKCDCGATFERRGSAVRLAIKRRGFTSCGCKQTEAVAKNGRRNRRHGVSVDHPKLYDVFRQMHRRCHDRRCRDYPQYGGRGVYVCDEWSDVVIFAEWALASGYASGLQIDRIDGAGPYSPHNCRWVDAVEQARNTRRNRIITAHGKSACASEWEKITGISVRTLLGRLNRGWPHDKIVTLTPISGRNQHG